MLSDPENGEYPAYPRNEDWDWQYYQVRRGLRDEK